MSHRGEWHTVGPWQPTDHVAIWPALAGQEFVKNYLLENTVTTAIDFLIRAPLATQEPWSSFEPHPCLRSRKLGQKVRAAFSEVLREGQPLSVAQATPMRLRGQDIPPAPSWSSSLCHSSVPSQLLALPHMLTCYHLPLWPFVAGQRNVGQCGGWITRLWRRAGVEHGFTHCLAGWGQVT